MSGFVNTVDSIGDEALTSSIIDGSITEILDNHVREIKAYALYDTKLTKACFQAAMSIGDNSFASCSALMTADFHVAASIGQSAFNYCKELTTLILRSETMATLRSSNAFANTPIKSGTGYIYVPAALVDSYKAASNWSTYAGQIRAIEDYPEICG